MYNLRELITDEEYSFMEQYREMYVFDDYTDTSEITPLKDILNIWERDKQLLYRLLGNQLILTKTFEYAKPIEELMEECGWLKQGKEYGRDKHKGINFYTAYIKWVDNTYPAQRAYNPYWVSPGDSEYLTDEVIDERSKINLFNDSLRSLISNRTLSENRWNGANIEIALPDGKSFTIKKGSKPLRSLSKIANAYNLEGFEEFRICHSLIHNDKKLKGDISLSIHPLDYWTMSDNTYGWNSCMSWNDYGCYRRGTVEMMNSPMVIVAYLSNSNTMYKPFSSEIPWNSKKWRMLFIVQRNVILGIKDYPYTNNDLAAVTINWIRDLAKENLNWTYHNDEIVWNKGKTESLLPYYENGEETDKKWIVSFDTDTMYNDTLSRYGGSPCFYYSPPEEDLYPMYFAEVLDRINALQINYSGASVCMICGRVDGYYEGEGALACDDCYAYPKCSYCGESVLDEQHYVHGELICSDCYENDTNYCQSCNDLYWNDEVNNYTLIVDTINSSETDNRLLDISLIEEFVTICESCKNDLINNGFKEGCELTRYVYTNERYDDVRTNGIRLSQLNEYGVKMLSVWAHESDILKWYKGESTVSLERWYRKYDINI